MNQVKFVWSLIYLVNRRKLTFIIFLFPRFDISHFIYSFFLANTHLSVLCWIRLLWFKQRSIL